MTTQYCCQKITVLLYGAPPLLAPGSIYLLSPYRSPLNTKP